MNKINEAFLHFLWKHHQLTGIVVTPVNGNKIHVLDPGMHNHDAGPDFFNAKIDIDGTVWAGNVELHINASDWIRHGHTEDPAYHSVILHIVYFNDCEITRPDGQVVPAATLRFPSLMWNRYADMMQSSRWVACQDQLVQIAPLYVAQWTSALMIEKLQERSISLQRKLEEAKGHWDALLSSSIFRSFGLPVNTTPFEMLTLLAPYPVLLRQKYDLFTIEAILFGKAGMLDTTLPEDAYVEGLRREYYTFRGRLGDQTVPYHVWKYMRMRPSSFPSLRIAQLAALISELYPPHQFLETMPSTVELIKTFRIRAGDYWNNHYRFGKLSQSKPKYIGKEFIHSLIINGIVPYIFFFGKKQGKQAFCDYAIHLLEELPEEHNVISKNWGKFGLKSNNAFDSQALLLLYKNYCREKRCLECQFGNNLIIDGQKA